MALDEAGFPGASGSNTVQQSHVEQFKDEVIHLAQQM